MLYNAALEQRVTAWKQARKSITLFMQAKQLTELRRSDPDWEAVPALIQRSALRRLDFAFAAFFRRCRSGDVFGFPRFRSARRYDSFALGPTCGKNPVVVRNDRVLVPKLGHVKMNLYRPIEGTIKDAIIRRDAAGKWWINFQCDLGEAPPKVAVRAMVGIDLGLTTLATLSTGEQILNPRFAKRAAKKLARRQRFFARKQEGSRNRERSRILVVKTHVRVANQRRDYARKEAKHLFERFDLVAHEDLSIAKLAGGAYSKSISDASWDTFLRCLASKAEEAGKYLVPVDPRMTSQLCSACGEIIEKNISEREHRCVCGLTIDRDHNAAINVLARGQRVLELERSGVEGKAP